MPKKKGTQNKTTYGEASQIYEYVKRNQDRLPDYWQDKGLRVCIDGICCMIVRDKYTDYEIADYYGCPVPLIDAIRFAYKKTIRNLMKEHEQTIELFGDRYLNPNKEDDDNLGYVELLSAMLGR